MQEVSFLQSLHSATKRDYLARMNAEKPDCMRVAKEYGKDYWDGDRKYGYGGYKYDGRWKPVAEALALYYRLNVSTKIIDIGCGKGYLLYEFKNIIHQGFCRGIEPSQYARCNAKEEIRSNIACYTAQETKRPIDHWFGFSYSINVLHNLGYKDLKQAIREMVRVTKPEGKSYICVESYRTEEELCHLQCWALTCQSFYSPDDWKEILMDNGYKGDVEFITFQ